GNIKRKIFCPCQTKKEKVLAEADSFTLLSIQRPSRRCFPLLPERLVNAVFLYQFLVSPFLADPAMVNHHNLIGISYSSQSMGNGNQGFPSGQFPDGG